jgi:hypothetical protein
MPKIRHEPRDKSSGSHRGAERWGRRDLLEGDVPPIELTSPLEFRALNKESCLKEVDCLFPQWREPNDFVSLHLPSALEICAHIIHSDFLHELCFGLDRAHGGGN